MKKVIIIPDSFKGTLSAKQICRILKEKVHQQFPACEVVTVPVAGRQERDGAGAWTVYGTYGSRVRDSQ